MSYVEERTGDKIGDIKELSQAKDLSVTSKRNFRPSRRCLNTANKAEMEASRRRSAKSCREPEVFCPFSMIIVRPYLKHCAETCMSYLIKF